MQYYEWIIKARDESQVGVDQAKRKMDEITAYSKEKSAEMRQQVRGVLGATSLTARGISGVMQETFGQIGMLIGQISAAIASFMAGWQMGLKIQSAAWKMFVSSIKEGWDDAENALKGYTEALRTRYSGAVQDAHKTAIESQKEFFDETKRAEQELAREERKAQFVGVITGRPDYEIAKENAEKRIKFEKESAEKILAEREKTQEKIKELERTQSDIEKKYFEESKGKTGDITRAKREEWERTRDAVAKAVENMKQHIEKLNTAYAESENKILEAQANIVKAEREREEENRKALEKLAQQEEKEAQEREARAKKQVELARQIEDIEFQERVKKMQGVQKKMGEELAKIEEELANVVVGKEERLRQREEQREEQREARREANIRKKMQIRGLTIAKEEQEWFRKRELEAQREQLQRGIAEVQKKVEAVENKKIAENTKRTADELVAMKAELQQLLVLK